MLSYQEFENYIEIIRHYSNLDEKIGELFEVDGISCISSKATESIIELLEVIMDDKENQWIEYWLWELDFGVKDNNSVSMNDVHIPLTTIKDLYSILLKGRDNV